MKRLLLLMLAMMVGWLPAVAQAWWQPDWQYRKQISVDTTPEGAAISESVGRTPLLVRLHTGNFFLLMAPMKMARTCALCPVMIRPC